MFSSYKKEDVAILLKDISGLIKPQSTEEREYAIQHGTHYSEMLPLEYEPSPEYLNLYLHTLKTQKKKTADAVGKVAKEIYKRHGKNVVLVSLARAGTPIGILVKRYFDKNYQTNIPHYTISIIRDKGIDHNAMRYILERYSKKDIQFIDGWVGKGTIQKQLFEAMKNYEGVDSTVATLADPGFVSPITGSREDFLIPSSCLNSTVSGLLSRTVLRSDLIGENDFHGAVFYQSLMNVDRTYEFIDTIEKEFDFSDGDYEIAQSNKKLNDVTRIINDFDIKDINFVKPGIGETTRVLLRRLPWKILVYSLDDQENLGHIYQLAKEKNVPVELYRFETYKCCGIIRSIKDA